VASFLATPARLMLCVWGVFLALVRWGPIRYERPIALVTSDFVIACVALFVAGAVLAGAGVRRASPFPTEPVDAEARFDRGVRRLALLGIVGMALVVIDKVFLNRADFSEGLGALRLALQMDAEAGSAKSFPLWLGSLLYSFSNAALVLYVLRGERCQRSTGLLVGLASFAPAVVIVLYGGRSSALLTLVLLLAAGLVRAAAGQQVVSRAPFLRALCAVHLLVVVAGSLFIFATRAEAWGETGADHIERVLIYGEGRVARNLEPLIEGDDRRAALMASVLMSYAYLTHSFAELDFLLTRNGPAGPFWGSYQAALPVRALRLLLGMRDTMFSDLDDPLEHAGVFMTAWGAMYLDFGLWLAPIASGVLGLLAGLAYQKGIGQGSLIGRLFLSYAFLYVLLSPVHSAFAWGNSLQTLICFALAPVVLSVSLDRPFWPWRRDPAAESA
jgi:hypothetical protein